MSIGVERAYTRVSLVKHGNESVVARECVAYVELVRFLCRFVAADDGIELRRGISDAVNSILDSDIVSVGESVQFQEGRNWAESAGIVVRISADELECIGPGIPVLFVQR